MNSRSNVENNKEEEEELVGAGTPAPKPIPGFI
jgi:hypothetical protein